MALYNFKEIEAKWQKRWEKENLYHPDINTNKPKYYSVEMFLYPSGKIHMGHVRNYTIGDVVARYRRMKGFNVLHPVGFDSFGMPAENAAIKGGAHPKIYTDENIAYMSSQLKHLALSYNWKGEVRTCDPEFYKWNQWLFLKFHEKDLAYQAERTVNWCPSCKTVLANEQVIEGLCWRCDTEVTFKNMKQWFLRLSSYAEALEKNLDSLTFWPERVKTMQRNWIGRSEGTEIDFAVEEMDEKITIFTTRLDTIYGCTFIVLAPEHQLVSRLIKSAEASKVGEFINSLRGQSTKERAISKEKTGVFTGSFAINPFNGERIPVFLANFVLMEYGTGAIMSVPAHDERDFEFSKKYSLPLRVVIQPGGLDDADISEAYIGDGVLERSGAFSGKKNREMIPEMVAYAEKKGFGKNKIAFKLKDWGISRQRYWGTPIPIIFCLDCGIVPVPEKDLPVMLPYDVELTGTGESPLKNHPTFSDCSCPKCGKKAQRETDTMDTFVDSSWYFMRYTDSHNKEKPFDSARADFWFPMDFYIGGIEHATMHLIYCRFFTMVMKDLGLIGINEPIKCLMCQGMVTKDGAKMSKSIGNTVDPDDIFEKYGSDTARLFILFAAPPEKDLEWSDEGVEGSFRFIGRVYNLITELVPLLTGETRIPSNGLPLELRRRTHRLIKKVTEELDNRFHFNTAIAALMSQIGWLSGKTSEITSSPEGRYALTEAIEALCILLNPLAPHLAHEGWELIGHNEPLDTAQWLSYDEELAKEDTVVIAVQVNGRVRGQFQVPVTIDGVDAIKMAKEIEGVKRHIGDKSIIKEIYVPCRLVSLVVN